MTDDEFALSEENAWRGGVGAGGELAELGVISSWLLAPRFSNWAWP